MQLKYFKIVKPLSVIVLFFFLWSFGGFYELAYAVTRSNQPSAISVQQQNNNSQQPKPQRPEAQFQKTIEIITQILADTVIDTDTKKNRLKTSRAAIEALDVELKKQFSDTEKLLKDKGLPNEILERHYKFLRHYDDNLKELKANLSAIDHSAKGIAFEEAIQKAKAHLEKVKPPKKHKPLDLSKLPHRMLEIKSFEVIERQPDTVKEDDSSNKPILVASIGSLDGLLAQASTTTTITTTGATPPTDADLAESVEIKFTPEILAKVAEIGSSPVKLYEHVRNRFAYEPYYGSLKGGQQTLFEMAGNDIDLASALIALLRSANIPSRYVCGTIELTTDRLMNWLGGVKDPMTAAQIMATNGIPGKLLTEAGTVKYAQFDHCWVEAYVDMFPSMGAVNRQGKYWTPLDPSMKEMLIREGENVAKGIPFDEMAYLSTANNEPPLLTYFNSLNESYTATHQEDLFTTLYGAGPKWQEFGILPGTLPYKVLSQTRYSEIPDTKRYKIRFGLIPADIYDTGTVSIEKPLPELAGKKLTLSYTPATQTDQTIINSYGGLLNTPVYLLYVKPEIKVNDTTILTGSEIGLGTTLTLSVGISSPNLGIDIVEKCISFGISFAVGIPALNNSAIQLADRTNILSGLQGTLNDSLNAMDSGAGELLNNIAIEYFSQLDIATRAIKSLMHIQNTRKPSVAVVSADVEYETLFGMPVSPPRPIGLTIDALRTAFSPISLDGDMNNRKEFIKLRGLNSSYLEHKVIENLLMKGEAVSAVKALQTASQNGIPLYKINSSNIELQLPLLTVSSIVKENIRNAVNAGKEVMVSRDNVTISSWSGVGYIVNDPVSGVGEYMISDAFSGGHWECPVSGNCNVYLDASIGAEAIIAHGVLKTGEWLLNELPSFVWGYDLITEEVLGLFEAVMWGKFNYTPSLLFDASDNDLKNIFNSNRNIWIFHFSGHGGIDTVDGTGFINEGTIGAGGLLCKTCKIVFLNGCKTGAAGVKEDFMFSFDIDQFLRRGETEIARKEAYMGWDSDISIGWAAAKAYKFWQYLGEGKTIDEAFKMLCDNKDPCIIEDPDPRFDGKLIYGGNKDTTLEMWK